MADTGRRRSDRVRLVDVADHAGVTKSVASRVLTGDATLSVRPETRERVLGAALELGYRAHAGARALAGAEARALALLIPDLANPVYTRIIRGAYLQAQQLGYVVLLAEDPADDGEDEAFAELVESGRVDGLLIASARPGHVLVGSGRLRDIPHVFVNREVAGSGHNVTMDLAKASATAVGHLHELGHRRIGMVSGPLELSPAQARERGFVEAMEALQLDPTAIERESFTEAGGATAAARLVEDHPEITAIYASTLTQAVGVLHGLRGRGCRVPEDVSLIAYDDLPLADYLDPPLTTVAMPLLELGAAAVDSVVAQLQGRPAADTLVPTEPNVIVRKSVGRR